MSVITATAARRRPLGGTVPPWTTYLLPAFTGALIGALMLLTWGAMQPLAVAAVLAGALSITVALSLRSTAAGPTVPGETHA